MALGFAVVVLALRFLVERTEMVFVPKASEKPLLRHEVLCAIPPSFFWRKFPVWQGYWADILIQGRVRALIQEQVNVLLTSIPERF